MAHLPLAWQTYFCLLVVQSFLCVQKCIELYNVHLVRIVDQIVLLTVLILCEEGSLCAGGYEDDRDEGEWFLYTGSGGRDLSGNKRTNKAQAHDQTFESFNKALLKTCERGLPVRVVRSYKEKRSAYAPTDEACALRYDGIYKVVACWRIVGKQGLFLGMR